MNNKYIDLQLFADTTVNTTVSTATGNDLSPEMKTFYDMNLIDEASALLVHDQFGQKRPIPANSAAQRDDDVLARHLKIGKRYIHPHYT